jgi:ABC-2 type transport system ATP-binding protein
MFAIAKKALRERSRNRIFWLFTILFSLLFPGLVTLVYKLQAGGSSGAQLTFSGSFDPGALPDGPVRVAVVGEPPQSFLENEKLTLVRFASVEEASEAAVATAVRGFPWPFAFGVVTPPGGGNVTLLLPNKQQNATDNNAVDAASYLLASLQLAPLKVRLESYPVPNGDALGANFGFAIYGPILYVFGCVFIVPAMLQMVVKDKLAKAYFLRIGLSKMRYWLGLYVVDVTTVLLLLAVGAAVVLGAQVAPLSSQAGFFVLALSLFALAAPVLSYCASFVFTSEETAQKWGFAVFSLTFVLLSVPSIVSSAVGASVTVQRYATLVPCGIYPPIALSRVFGLIASNGDETDFKVAFVLQVFSGALWALVLFVLDGGLNRRRAAAAPVGAERLAVYLENLQVSYKSFACCCRSKRTRAVNGVSLEVRPGEIFSLLGPNGAGKTSLIQVISGNVEAQESGTALLLGMDASDPRVSRDCSFVAQFDIVLDLLTANEFLQTVASIRGIDAAAALPLLEKLDLTAVAGQRLTQLSGGQRRKVSLCAALMSNPRLLVLDEPTAGIDVGSRRQVHELLVTHTQQHGGTVFFSSHSMDEVLEIATRVGMLVKGRMEAVGTVSELLKQYANGFLVRIHHESDGVALLQKLDAAVGCKVDVELNVGSALHIMVDSNAATAGQLFRVLQELQREDPTMRFTCSHGTLQNAFVKFVELQARAEEEK